MPPLKNAPNGTSAIMRMRTDSSNSSRKCRRDSSFAQARPAVVRKGGQLPVAALAHRRHPRRTPSSSPAGACERPESAVRIGNIAELEVEPERLPVDFQRNAGRSQALQLASEIQTRRASAHNTAASCRNGREPAGSCAAARPRSQKANMPRNKAKPSAPFSSYR